MKGLAKAPSIDLLESAPAVALVTHVWNRAFRWYLAGVLINFVLLLVLSSMGYDIRVHQPIPKWKVPFAIIHVLKKVGAEAAQLYHLRPTTYLSDNNFPDIVAVFFELMALYNLFLVELPQDEKNEMLKHGLFGLWISYMWLMTAYDLRGFEPFGPRMMPILSAVKDTVPFFVVTLLVLASASMGLYVIGTQPADSEGFGMDIYASLLAAGRYGVLGDFDLMDLEGRDDKPFKDKEATKKHFLVHVWFIIVGFVITILMMNLLIGILASNYDRFEEQWRALFIQERAGILSRMVCYERLGYGLFVMYPEEWEMQYLWYTESANPTVNAERSSRKVFQLQLDKMEKRVLKAIGDQKDGTDKQDKRMQAIMEHLVDIKFQTKDPIDEDKRMKAIMEHLKIKDPVEEEEAEKADAHGMPSISEGPAGEDSAAKAPRVSQKASRKTGNKGADILQPSVSKTASRKTAVKGADQAASKWPARVDSE